MPKKRPEATKLYTESMTKLLKLFDEFLADENEINVWLTTKIVRVYVRKSIWGGARGFYGLERVRATDCLDVATIEVEEKYQGCGVFRQFMTHALKVSPYDRVVLERVMNPILHEWAHRHGWKPFLDDSYWFALTDRELESHALERV